MHATTTVTGKTTVPRVTLYVKDSDGPIWDRAKALVAGKGDDSLSSFVTEALQAHLTRRERSIRVEAESSGMELIELEGVDGLDEDKSRKLRFTGTLAYEGQDVYVYVTKRKKVVVEGYNPHGPNSLQVYDDFDEFREGKHGLDEAEITTVADAIGVDYYEDID